MKRLIIIIGVIFSLLTCNALANDVDTKFEITPTISGETVDILIKYNDNTDMCGGSFNFVYDKTKLEVLCIEEGEIIKNTTHFVNQNYADNAIRVNWVSTTEMPENGQLIEIKFKLLDKGFVKDNISIDSLKVADGDGKKLVAEYEVIYQDSETPPENNTLPGNSNSSNRRPSTIVTNDEKGTDEQENVATSVLTFADVKEDDWYYESVQYVFNNNLMKGISEVEFAPQNTVTRAMLVTVLYRLENEPGTDGSLGFIDVGLDSYYVNAVLWAKEHGIVSGISEKEFAPDKNITREQIATIIYRYAEYKGYDVSIGRNANVLPYTDFVNISEYAISPMQYAIVSGILKGKTETTLNPLDNATRAEIAAILQRFIESNK